MLKSQKYIAIFLFIGLALSACEKEKEDDLDSRIKGLWISETSDSLCFGYFLKINNSLPYSYKLTEDSIAIFPSWSSNLNDWRSYEIATDQLNDELVLNSFMGYSKIVFSKQTDTCN